ncbi:hypothetical protein B0A52_00106 [Exophiala mesophila]|uniref:Uncharacterized protein n=1 Tax=Exophiala mesophila TaxID=212818 RepID=A0A438NJ43_EXOME|nr:hypothetical protein B0A52_00106 [Exophiala mesophila]
MATAGFPWSGQSRDPEKESPPSQPIAPSSPPNNNSHVDSEILSHKTSSSSHCSQTRKGHTYKGKGRNGSLKGPPAVKPPILKAIPSSNNRVSKATSPLPVRTIPAWVRDAEEDDFEDPDFTLPDSPHAAFVAQHHHGQATLQRPLLSGQHARRNSHITSSGHGRRERTSRWITFARASAYPRENFHGEKVDNDWLDQNMTDYSKPWLADHEEDEEDSSSRYRAFRRKRQVWYKRAQFTILRNPFIPLAFRLTIFLFALLALGLGVSIFKETGRIQMCVQQPVPRTPDCQQLVGAEQQDYYRDPSGLMAIIVDAIALVYTLYITYDEYFSKPLGLRPARAKVRLVLLDLFFVVFQSANLSLSFESLTVDEGACQVGDDPRTSSSVLRLVERINTN